MVAVAIVGSAVVGGVAASSASSKASKAATSAADKNNALQQQIYGQNKAALTPFMNAGGPATSAIQALLGLGGDKAAAEGAFNTFRNATGYQDQFNEGQRSVTGALGNRGLLDSGAAQKALTRYGHAQSNQSLGQYMGHLAGQQQIGLGAASALAGVGQNFANSVSINNNQAANAVGNAALSNANSINGILQSGLTAYGYSQGMGSSYGAKSGQAPPYNPGGFNDPSRNW
jgi:hypothetical protein